MHLAEYTPEARAAGNRTDQGTVGRGGSFYAFAVSIASEDDQVPIRRQHQQLSLSAGLIHGP
jgi:hypothetical protein